MSITRRTMLRASVGIIGGAAVATSVKSQPIQGDVYLALVKANDARVAGLISAASNADPRRGSIRRIAGDLEGLIAAFGAPSRLIISLRRWSLRWRMLRAFYLQRSILMELSIQEISSRPRTLDLWSKCWQLRSPWPNETTRHNLRKSGRMFRSSCLRPVKLFQPAAFTRQIIVGWFRTP